MTNPLIVEAAEELFVPLLVYNNQASDRATLNHFKEPSWNNPIVRYLDDQENDLVARKDLVLSVPETAYRMAKALRQDKHDVPEWLDAVAAPMKAKQLQQATFSMY